MCNGDVNKDSKCTNKAHSWIFAGVIETKMNNLDQPAGL